MIKKHLQGGSLRAVMVQEIIRVIRKYATQDQKYEHAALELGVTPRTLRLWRGPVDKGGWSELQGLGGIEMLAKAVRSK